MTTFNLDDGIAFLANAGLNLFAVLDRETLPDSIKEVMEKTAVPLQSYNRLLLLGHGGTTLWHSMTTTDWEMANPIDHYSIKISQTFITKHLLNKQAVRLYPLTEFIIPLQQLGEHAGWCHSSPLGLGISPKFGVWYAYRTAYLINAPLPIITATRQASPCNSCERKPCLTACPAKALHPYNPINISACAAHRLRPHSSCVNQCLSRLACPIAPEHQYSIEQISYHYEDSLTTLRHYYPA
ncbi:MAG: hypothetical protein GY943_27935 [Chloroflexi bacterium]|nr:hypothetical protein [Chloroflexota bacterium]